MEVEAQNLSMHFNDAGKQVRLFERLSFKVASGESLAIMGQSGVGKTTLLYLLGGLENPVGGDVLVGGQSYKRMRETGQDLATFRGTKVGFVFQFHNLLPEFDAVENVAMPLLIRGEPRKETFDLAKDLLVRVGLEERFHHRPGMLSGGEQQRVAVARAIAARPGVILADEPTGNLDQRTGAEVKDLLLRLQVEKRITLILVTHSLTLAESMDRVVELTPQGMQEQAEKGK